MFYKSVKKMKKGSISSHTSIDYLLDLIDKAKGDDRSYYEYAKEADVSPAAFSRIKKGDYVPSPVVIEKLTKNSEGRVTYAEMMQAAGHYTNALNITTGVLQTIHANDSFKEECTSKIYSLLVNKGIAFKKTNSAESSLTIELIDHSIREWTFIFVYCQPQKPFPQYRNNLNSALIDILRTYPESQSKTTIVINNNNQTNFYALQEYERRFITYPGDISIAFFNTENKEFSDEFYIASSDDAINKSDKDYLVEPSKPFSCDFNKDQEQIIRQYIDDNIESLEDNLDNRYNKESEYSRESTRYNGNFEILSIATEHDSHLCSIEAKASIEEGRFTEDGTDFNYYEVYFKFYIDADVNDQLSFACYPTNDQKSDEPNIIIEDQEPPEPY